MRLFTFKKIVFFLLLIPFAACKGSNESRNSEVSSEDIFVVLNKYSYESLSDTSYFSEATVLHDSVQAGDFKSVQSLLQTDIDVNQKDLLGYTPLHIAAQEGYIDIVKLLVKIKGAKVNVGDFLNTTPLHYAAEEGHLKVVQFLVEAGANFDNSDTTFQTPLHYAAEEGHLKVVQFLVEAGADINSGLGGSFGYGTPLDLAYDGLDKDEVIDYLESKGAKETPWWHSLDL